MPPPTVLVVDSVEGDDELGFELINDDLLFC